MLSGRVWKKILVDIIVFFLPQKQHGLSKPIKMTWKPVLECLGLDFDLEITWPKLKSHF